MQNPKISKSIFYIFSILLFIYIIWPGPTKISDFSPLPDSVKSTLAGDNPPQVPNVAGYFSNNFRDFVVPFYLKNYWWGTKLPFPPLRLNYPPEYSFVAIKKHTDTTYLEELVYPLRNSIYINGFEPFSVSGQPKYWGAQKFNIENRDWYTKTTIRFYPSFILVRIIVWFGIVLSVLFIFRLGKEVIFSK